MTDSWLGPSFLFLGRRRDVDYATRDHVLRLPAVDRHVGRGGVRLETIPRAPTGRRAR
jgi:hypothetical protein